MVVLGEGCLIDVWVELGSGAGLSVMLILFLDWWVPGSVIAVKIRVAITAFQLEARGGVEGRVRVGCVSVVGFDLVLGLTGLVWRPARLRVEVVELCRVNLLLPLVMVIPMGLIRLKCWGWVDLRSYNYRGFMFLFYSRKWVASSPLI